MAAILSRPQCVNPNNDTRVTCPIIYLVRCFDQVASFRHQTSPGHCTRRPDLQRERSRQTREHCTSVPGGGVRLCSQQLAG